ncbi:hypothetical protein IJ596_06975, partial [bacterium]|nr:hypothetical protein [bacterium]
MAGFVQKIRQMLAISKAKKLRNKLVSILKSLNPSGKRVYKDSADLSVEAANEEKQKFRENIFTILKNTNCECDKLLNYIQAAGTPVHYLANAQKSLAFIKEEPGLIYEQKGFEAAYLSFITERRFKFYTEPMFVVDENFNDKYTMLHNFYRWCSLKSGLPGFEYEVQKKLKQYLRTNKLNVKGMNLDEVEGLKQAISRDQEALEFVAEFVQEKESVSDLTLN